MMIRKVARPMLAAVFISQGAEALRRPAAAADAAGPTLAGLRKLPDPVGSRVPDNPDTVARVTAATQVAGGLLLAAGRVPRIASAALAVAELPANLGAHMFWAEPDAVTRSRKRRDFMVDLSLLGGLIIATADTAGKPSLGWRGRRAAKRVTEAVALTAAERSAPLIATARKQAGERVEMTRDRVGSLAEEAKTEARRLTRQ